MDEETNQEYQYDKHSIYSKSIVTIGQNPYLENMSIKSNLILGRGDAND